MKEEGLILGLRRPEKKENQEGKKRKNKEGVNVLSLESSMWGAGGPGGPPGGPPGGQGSASQRLSSWKL